MRGVSDLNEMGHGEPRATTTSGSNIVSQNNSFNPVAGLISLILKIFVLGHL